MTTSEHLNKIKAKCEQLLEIASKRTPGNNDCPKCHRPINKGNSPNSEECTETDDDEGVCEAYEKLAACAGPAEAGWRVTIAAIDSLLFIQSTAQPLLEEYCTKKLDTILAAWPEELL